MNLPWDIIVLATFCLLVATLLIAEVVKVLGHSVVWTLAYFGLRTRPAVIAAGKRGLYQRDQRNDR